MTVVIRELHSTTKVYIMKHEKTNDISINIQIYQVPRFSIPILGDILELYKYHMNNF